MEKKYVAKATRRRRRILRAGFFLRAKSCEKVSVKKKLKKIKKMLAFSKSFVYTHNCCDMIAMKREVAA